MTEKEQVAAFESELLNLVNRYSNEFELSYASVIGVLVLRTNELALDCITDMEKDD